MTDKLSSLRNEIDLLDEQLWDIIAMRINVARKIGEWKRANHQPIVQEQRFQEVLAHCIKWGEKYDFSKELILEIMNALHKESVRVES